MTPAEAFFADLVDIDPIAGRFLLPSGRVAQVREGSARLGIHFVSGEGRPAADIIVLVDTGREQPELVGGIMTEDASRYMRPSGGGHFYVPTEALLPPVAILHEAVACSVCGAWPSAFIEADGTRRCGQHWRREVA